MYYRAAHGAKDGSNNCCNLESKLVAEMAKRWSLMIGSLFSVSIKSTSLVEITNKMNAVSNYYWACFGAEFFAAKFLLSIFISSSCGRRGRIQRAHFGLKEWEQFSRSHVILINRGGKGPQVT